MKKSTVLFVSAISAQAETTTHKPYSFIFPNWIGSSQGVESCSQANASAFTKAWKQVNDLNFGMILNFKRKNYGIYI